jgi:hypothetical protein
MVRRSAPVRLLQVTVLAGLLCGAAAIASDAPGGVTTYRWVDAQGVVHYSDTPQPGAQQLHIPPAQTYQSPAATTGATSGAGQESAAGNHQDCRIVQPRADQAFFAPDKVPVSVELEPAAGPDEQITVTVDGATLTALDESGRHYQVEAPDRGTHTITATVRDGAGNIICTSAPVSFSVQRPSLHSPLAPGRGH